MLIGCGIGTGHTFADKALLDKAPQHVATMMTIRRFVEGLLAETVAVLYGLRRLFCGCRARHLHRRHYVVSQQPPYKPDFFTEN